MASISARAPRAPRISRAGAIRLAGMIRNMNDGMPIRPSSFTAAALDNLDRAAKVILPRNRYKLVSAAADLMAKAREAGECMATVGGVGVSFDDAYALRRRNPEKFMGVTWAGTARGVIVNYREADRSAPVVFFSGAKLREWAGY